MATIKSYTDIGQSRKLARILSIESSDMYYEDDISVEFGHGWHSQHTPCWSLAALLCVLPKGYSLGRRTTGKYYVCMTHIEHKVSEYDNPVDACVTMIEKLHELNLL